MARSRNIKPSFFKNEDLAELDFVARLLYIGLWTLADREGYLEDRPKRIKIELFPGDNVDVDAALQQLHDKRFIQRYQVDGCSYIAIPTFLKHQNPHHREIASTIPKPEALPPMQPGAGLRLSSDGSAGSPGLGSGEPGASRADSLIPDSPSLIPDSRILKKTTHGDDSAEQKATLRGAMSKALRDEGVKITPSHPQLIAWCESGVTIQILREAIDLARMNKPKPENIPPAYLAPIVNDLINGKAKGVNGHSPGRLDWWATDAGWQSKAKELGIVEPDFLMLKARVCKRLGPGSWVDERNATLKRLIEGVEA